MSMERKPIKIIRKDLEAKVNVFEQASFDMGAATLKSENPKKTRNEDSNFYTKFGLGVFDGVGGASGGDLASSTASNFLFQRVMEMDSDIDIPIDKIKADLKIRIEQAHAHVKVQGRLVEDNPATTADVVVFRKDEMGLTRAVIGHVGDSRVYILNRSGNLRLCTQDDSAAVNSLRKYYGLSEAEIERIQKIDSLNGFNTDAELYYLANRNVISDALGGPRCEVKIYSPLVEDGDVLLAVTDGVSDNLNEAEIVQICSGDDTAEKKAHNLVQKALEVSRGDSFNAKKDDMTAVVVNVRFNK